MSDGPASFDQVVGGLAERLGVTPPTPDEVRDLLALAGVAAHASQRIAAPIACWLVARGGITPADGLALVREVAAEHGHLKG